MTGDHQDSLDNQDKERRQPIDVSTQFQDPILVLATA